MNNCKHVKIQRPVTYKYLHKVRSAVLASASKHKIPKTRKPRQTWKRLFSQPTRKVRMLCNLLLRRKLCTTAGFLRSETCIHAINSPTQLQSSRKNIMKSPKLKYRLSKTQPSHKTSLRPKFGSIVDVTTSENSKAIRLPS